MFFSFRAIIGWYFFSQSNFKGLFGSYRLIQHYRSYVRSVWLDPEGRSEIWALADLFSNLMAGTDRWLTSTLAAGMVWRLTEVIFTRRGFVLRGKELKFKTTK